MPADEYTKDPGATLDYELDWTKWIGTDTIASVAWAIAGPDGSLTQPGSPVASHTTTTATVWLSGGTAGSTYRVSGTITTNGGRIDTRTIKINAAAR